MNRTLFIAVVCVTAYLGMGLGFLFGHAWTPRQDVQRTLH